MRLVCQSVSTGNIFRLLVPDCLPGGSKVENRKSEIFSLASTADRGFLKAAMHLQRSGNGSKRGQSTRLAWRGCAS